MSEPNGFEFDPLKYGKGFQVLYLVNPFKLQTLELNVLQHDFEFDKDSRWPIHLDTLKKDLENLDLLDDVELSSSFKLFQDVFRRVSSSLFSRLEDIYIYQPPAHKLEQIALTFLFTSTFHKFEPLYQRMKLSEERIYVNIENTYTESNTNPQVALIATGKRKRSQMIFYKTSLMDYIVVKLASKFKSRNSVLKDLGYWPSKDIVINVKKSKKNSTTSCYSLDYFPYASMKQKVMDLARKIAKLKRKPSNSMSPRSQSESESESMPPPLSVPLPPPLSVPLPPPLSVPLPPPLSAPLPPPLSVPLPPPLSVPLPQHSPWYPPETYFMYPPPPPPPPPPSESVSPPPPPSESVSPPPPPSEIMTPPSGSKSRSPSPFLFDYDPDNSIYTAPITKVKKVKKHKKRKKNKF